MPTGRQLAGMKDTGTRTQVVLTGPKGDKGDKGDPGDVTQGPKGERGERGERGPAGPKGETGPEGARGPQGERGPKGDRGEKGEPGAKGAQGERGERGEKGDTGERGLKGDPGEKGERGDRGEHGERGAKGDTGPQGERGEKGESIEGPAGKSFAVELIAVRKVPAEPFQPLPFKPCAICVNVASGSLVIGIGPSSVGPFREVCAMDSEKRATSGMILVPVGAFVSVQASDEKATAAIWSL